MFGRKNDIQNNGFEIENKIDFTLLDPRATESDLEKLCDIAYKRSYYAVCVNPCNVGYVKGYIQKNLLGKIKIVSVIGFPLGANSILKPELSISIIELFIVSKSSFISPIKSKLLLNALYILVNLSS